MTILVKNLLNNSHFNSAKVLAGHQGLDREVKWVHIVEIARFGHLLNGKEVILTTGLGWAHDEERILAYLKNLLDINVSALAIEFVLLLKNIPKKLIYLAEKIVFLIIAFQ